MRSVWLVNLTQPGITRGQVIGTGIGLACEFFFLKFTLVRQPNPPWLSLFLMLGDPELRKCGAIKLSTSEHTGIASLWSGLDVTEFLLPWSPCCDEQYLELWARIKSFSPELLLVRVSYLHSRSGARINLELTCLYLSQLMFSREASSAAVFEANGWSQYLHAWAVLCASCPQPGCRSLRCNHERSHDEALLSQEWGS